MANPAIAAAIATGRQLRAGWEDADRAIILLRVAQIIAATGCFAVNGA
jgi:hypothetical protein